MDPRFPASEGGCEGGVNYTTPACFYTSPTIHNVALPALSSAAEYEYRIGGERTFAFRTPPAAGAERVTFGVVGDLGQTLNSTATIAGLRAAAAAGSIDTLLHAGDLSYADGNGYRWDSYGRLIEPLASVLPVAHAGGNHEVSNGGENWVAYAQRYPNNHAAVASESVLWYSFESGPAHVVVLCSYADSRAGSSQYAWLEHDLARIDRAKTPWIIVMFHTPWYTSNAHHPITEGAAMRASLEPMLVAAGVDLVFNGHVHAYWQRAHAPCVWGHLRSGARDPSCDDR